jgi:hypothetical protein
MNEEHVYLDARFEQGAFLPRQKLRPSRDLFEYAQQYAKEKPAVVALACLGIGFILGWKLKPW